MGGPVEVALAVLEEVLEAPVGEALQEVRDPVEVARLGLRDLEAVRVGLLVLAKGVPRQILAERRAV